MGKPVMNRRGQSTLEYLLMLGVILLALIAFGSGTIRTGIQNVLTNSGQTIDAAAGKVQGGLGL